MEALEIPRDHCFDLILTDVRMSASVDGVGLLKWGRRNHRTLPVILTSAYTMRPEIVLRPGRLERFIAKPADALWAAETLANAPLGGLRQVLSLAGRESALRKFDLARHIFLHNSGRSERSQSGNRT